MTDAAGAGRMSARAICASVGEFDKLSEPIDLSQRRKPVHYTVRVMHHWDAARDAGRWRGISEGKDIVIKQLEAERDALRAELAAARAALTLIAHEACGGICAGSAAVNWERAAKRAAGHATDALAALREAGHETRALTPDEQKIMRRALRRSVKIVGEAEGEFAEQQRRAAEEEATERGPKHG